jgi:hypothetical protein
VVAAVDHAVFVVPQRYVEFPAANRGMPAEGARESEITTAPAR